MTTSKSKIIKVHFSKGELTKTITVDKENSQYFLIGARLKSADWVTNFYADYRLISKKETKSTGGALIATVMFPNISSEWRDIETNNFHQIENGTGFEKIKFEIHCDVSIELELTLTNSILEVAFQHLFPPFKSHIDQYNNTKILFSAPFGQGKTTFLNEYFAHHSEEYEVFRISPVNYSVSQNEDIFRYIKAELFIQLLSLDIEFDDNFEPLTHQGITKYIKAYWPIILGELLKVAGKTGQIVTDSIIDKVVNFIKKNKKESSEKDDKILNEFTQTIFSNEGGIYEDNVYTQIIRQLVAEVRKTGKQVILVIDDLDRIDPEHIFRILNVFSAHIDSENNAILGINNKFDFDKVILICDLQNIRQIYEHKYGANTDFAGYINKFYSIEPFKLNNQRNLAEFVNNLKIDRHNDSPYEVFKYIIIDLISIGEFTFRDFVKFGNLDISLMLNGKVTEKNQLEHAELNNLHLFMFILIHYLNKIFDRKSLEIKLSVDPSLSL